MKTWTKILLIVGVFLILLGAAAAALGYFVFKAEPQAGIQLRDTKAPAADASVSIREAAPTVDPSVSVRETAPGAAAYAVPADGIREVEVNWVSGNVIIRPTDGSDILIEASGKDLTESLSLVTRGDELVINYVSRNKLLSFSQEKDLVLSVPRTHSPEEISVDVTSAKVTVEKGISLRSFSVDSASGSLEIKDLTVTGELSFESASGSISGTGDLREVNVETSSGAARLTLTALPRAIELETSSGDMELTLPKDGGYTLEFDTASGDFRSDDDYVTAKNGDIRFGDGSCRIEVDSASGDLTIRH